MPNHRSMAAPGRRTVLALLPGLGAASSRGAAQAEGASAWPQRRVRVITPAPPGSSLDLVARLMAERLGARWGQPVTVEGRPGADGIPALEAMIAAAPRDALFLANHGAITVTPLLNPRLGFDPMAALSPVLDLSTDLFGVAVPAALPVRDLAGLVGHARENPGLLNYTAAPGPPYLAMRAFLRDAGLDMVHVGFRGIGAVTVAEMLAGRLHVALAPLAPLVGAAREERLRVIAVTGAERAPALPGVPTSAEQGFPGFRQEGIHGLFGWKDMPDALRERIAGEAAAILADHLLAERLRGVGLQLRSGGTPAAFAALLAEQRERWAGLAREFGAASAP
ncbi:Bug family tripartite tricarboxylate transporter substrate binding protein [Sabulicella glaciei]|uniref:Tripartite tricarboxylate transporter substrate binding protein n=1 Tax=Sabulicella glaciei TaxID=2984948 RepID=A0ABT3NVN2_9PROT|nr:tripartite tricarboxylate transporter substrate binding protein [Roseococcus sp. MDT2-1-1]MCW8086215.1 tripartite tricarboxylate transporter substrate binding protein [Roseococcus sp. MDT2-1-1]